jgi:hypothetical protein
MWCGKEVVGSESAKRASERVLGDALLLGLTARCIIPTDAQAVGEWYPNTRERQFVSLLGVLSQTL